MYEESLLQKVFVINKKYEDIAEITGENFNIFKILKMETREVGTHSAFLAELLKPTGCHGKGDTFLKAFIKIFKIPGFENIESIKAEVKVEVPFKHGRIDILIIPKNADEIVIENKIHASDQDKQLMRYQDEYPKCHLIYLTLYGTDPSIKSITDNDRILVRDKDFFQNSYKSDVLNWLIECRKETVEHPILRETISQYINLIKILTGQTMTDKQDKEIINIVISNPEYIEAAERVANSWIQIKYALVENFIKELWSKYLNQANIMFGYDSDCKIGDRGTGFWFYKSNWKYCLHFIFIVDFEEMNLQLDVVKSTEEISKHFEEELREKLREIGSGNATDSSIWSTYFEVWENCGWGEKNTAIPFIQEKVDSLIICVEKLMNKNLEFKKEWLLKSNNI